MTTQDLDLILDRIENTIDKKVNGKIDGLKKIVEEHNARHEADYAEVKEHIAEVKPIVQEYQQRVAAREYAKKVGDAVKWGGGIILTIAAVWALFFKQ